MRFVETLVHSVIQKELCLTSSLSIDSEAVPADLYLQHGLHKVSMKC